MVTKAVGAWRTCTVSVEELRSAATRGYREKVPVRRGSNEDAIRRYVESFDALPPIELIRTPEGLVVADGFLRAQAASRALPHSTQIKVRIRDGSLDEARARNVTANLCNGLALSMAERNQGILRLRHLNWSYADIGVEVHLSKQRIEQIVKSLDAPEEEEAPLEPGDLKILGDRRLMDSPHSFDNLHELRDYTRQLHEKLKLLRDALRGIKSIQSFHAAWYAGADQEWLKRIVRDAEEIMRELPSRSEFVQKAIDEGQKVLATYDVPPARRGVSAPAESVPALPTRTSSARRGSRSGGRRTGVAHARR